MVAADGGDIMAIIRMPFATCMKCRLNTDIADLLAIISQEKLQAIAEAARQKTGATYNPARTDLQWVRLTT